MHLFITHVYRLYKNQSQINLIHQTCRLCSPIQFAHGQPIPDLATNARSRRSIRKSPTRIKEKFLCVGRLNGKFLCKGGTHMQNYGHHMADAEIRTKRGRGN